MAKPKQTKLTSSSSSSSSKSKTPTTKAPNKTSIPDDISTHNTNNPLFNIEIFGIQEENEAQPLTLFHQLKQIALEFLLCTPNEFYAQQQQASSSSTSLAQQSQQMKQQWRDHKLLMQSLLDVISSSESLMNNNNNNDSSSSSSMKPYLKVRYHLSCIEHNVHFGKADLISDRFRILNQLKSDLGGLQRAIGDYLREKCMSTEFRDELHLIFQTSSRLNVEVTQFFEMCDSLRLKRQQKKRSTKKNGHDIDYDEEEEAEEEEEEEEEEELDADGYTNSDRAQIFRASFHLGKKCREYARSVPLGPSMLHRMTRLLNEQLNKSASRAVAPLSTTAAPTTTNLKKKAAVAAESEQEEATSKATTKQKQPTNKKRVSGAAGESEQATQTPKSTSKTSKTSVPTPVSNANDIANVDVLKQMAKRHKVDWESVQDATNPAIQSFLQTRSTLSGLREESDRLLNTAVDPLGETLDRLGRIQKSKSSSATTPESPNDSEATTEAASSSSTRRRLNQKHASATRVQEHYLTSDEETSDKNKTSSKTGDIVKNFRRSQKKDKTPTKSKKASNAEDTSDREDQTAIQLASVEKKKRSSELGNGSRKGKKRAREESDQEDDQHITPEKSKKKARVPFSAAEEQNLRDGVGKYKVGSWAIILKNYDFHPSRTGMALRDKWRNMIKLQL